MLASNQII